jgi:hypothetical protein
MKPLNSLPVSKSAKSHPGHKKQQLGSQKGISNQVGVDGLTGNSVVSGAASDPLTQPDSPKVAFGVKGRADTFTYQNLQSSTPFDIHNFNFDDGDHIQLPGAIEDIWRQYNIQYQVTTDGIVSQVMHGNQLVGVVHAQIGITSLI